MNNKLTIVWIVSVLGGAAPSVSFQPPLSTTAPSSSTLRTPPPRASIATASPRPATTRLRLSQVDLLLDPSYLGGSFLWALNFYYGFDWILAPLGTGWDSDFNPSYRTATFLGSLLAGKSLSEAYEASGSIVDEDGERPEMGSRIGSGANVGYATAALENDDQGDWLSDREAGLRSSAPLFLRLGVAVLYGIFGLLAMALAESLQTAAVLLIPALVYEIGRPSLPTREEAIFDAKLDQAVADFCAENVLVYGQEIVPDSSLAPVRRDEATNERELVSVFRRKVLAREGSLQNQDISDFQIEMRFRELGTGRSEGGFIKGLRLLREPVSWQ